MPQQLRWYNLTLLLAQTYYCEKRKRQPNMARQPEQDEQTPILRGRRHSEAREACDNSHTEDGGNSRLLQTTRLYLTIGSTYLGLLLVAMGKSTSSPQLNRLVTPPFFFFGDDADVTLVSTLSATMASNFSSLALVSWLGTSYLVASAAVQPLCGKLTDNYGRPSGFFMSLTLFTTGNIICGLASSSWVLVLGRVIAGVGGGASKRQSYPSFVMTTDQMVPLC